MRRAPISPRARQQEGDSALGKAIRAWLANEKDGAAADLIEANRAGGRPDPHPLRRDHARGRPCRQCPAANRRRPPSIAGSCRASTPSDAQAELQQVAGQQGRGQPRPELSRQDDAGVAACAPTSSRPWQARSQSIHGPPCRSFRSCRPAPATARSSAPPAFRSTTSTAAGAFPRRRARPRPRRAHPGPRHVRRCSALGDGAEGACRAIVRGTPRHRRELLQWAKPKGDEPCSARPMRPR